MIFYLHTGEEGINMKLIEQKEPYLANLLSSKKQKRKSYKKDTVLKNRSFRRYLKMNLEVGKEILKNDMDLNFNNVVGELRLNFTDKGEPEEFKLVVIKYRFRNKTKHHPDYEIGSAYYHKGEWWVNFHNPITFTENYEVLAWAEYTFI